MSRYRPKLQSLRLHKKKVLNSLTAIWGVEPIGTIKEAQASKMFKMMLKELEKIGRLKKMVYM